MTAWRPQAFKAEAIREDRPAELVNHALEIASNITARTPGAEPILSLRHLSHLTDSRYFDLRRLVERSWREPYSVFTIKKRPLAHEKLRFRNIAVPAPWLMNVQRWVKLNILDHIPPHHSSAAFFKNSSVKDTAQLHCNARWLIKIDLRNFFESIPENRVYRIFETAGYQPLISFELARLCTRVGGLASKRNFGRYAANSEMYGKIPTYSNSIMGHLPQGAPTSPHLANLVAKELDKALSELSTEYNLHYTRYADDLIFSTKNNDLTRDKVRNFIGEVYRDIALNGFSPNSAKTTVSPPGARKVVLGLLVDTGSPRLTREFKSNIRKHLYYLQKDTIGPSTHAERNNSSVYGLRNHLLGLIQYARHIEPNYGNECLQQFNQVNW